MRPTIMVLIAASLAACATAGPRNVEIVTEPPDALVRVEGYGECQSPCIVQLDAPRAVTIAKAGYKARRIELTPAKPRIVVPLELAAPTKPVEESEIPRL